MRVLLFVLFCCPAWLYAQTGTLVFAYPEREKPPLIAEAPDNHGLYLDLYAAAARKIGMQLKVVRLPKKRIFSEMRAGTVDLYSGSFAADRADFMNWAENGLVTRELCITRDDVAPLTDLDHAPRLRLIVEIGDSRTTLDARYPALIPTTLGARIDMPLAVKLLQGKRGDLFLIEEEPFLHYMQQKHLTSLAPLGLRAHTHCRGPAYPMLMGVSRFSSHYGGVRNPLFDARAPLSAHNLPERIAPDSTAGKLANALQQMKASGETRQLADKYLARPAGY
ncbi:hypothetical protein IGB42_01476 [Andreprevotia sp. IGB-42]|uniref:substrate-binding periplasmic protein n=1 Tax=Andreprevotia sp. IGB-42 TaxID=2497473 RepID=UPI001357543A|nr:hypothetical protein [Andreprevotia sp. IGB-42]KAF0813797.1 hypothetical protein IGB42_01476 [Andreprevotia sp. IGB-42]